MVICTQKKLEQLINTTLETTYVYLKNCYKENNIEIPKKINDLEKYVNELNKLRKQKEN